MAHTAAPAHELDHASAIASAATETDRVSLIARWILREFDAYYVESRGIPALAKRAFERRDPATSLALSKRRLCIYGLSIVALGEQLRACLPPGPQSERVWDAVEARYLPMIEGRYEADLAFAYLHSVHRKIYQDEWKPVAYSFSESRVTARAAQKVFRVFECDGDVRAERVAEMLRLPEFTIPHRDLEEDAALVALRAGQAIDALGPGAGRLLAIELIEAGFYRNRGAYLVGRMRLSGAGLTPFVIALMNGDEGIYVDALLTSEADAHNIFSSTLANFHVTNPHYHELSEFLYSIMPARPLGLHYSTIGFNHVGKVATMNELRRELGDSGEAFQPAAGYKGTVAIGFAAPSSVYNLKVIRDQPTAQYKWGAFEGIDSVLRKYSRVHEINRTGSMLDNIIYYNLTLERAWFGAELLRELLAEASLSVSRRGDSVIFKHLIVQRRQIPLPVFFQSASVADAEAVITNLGYCIKNNAAANIFNKDLDARNYGVSEFHKVFLYDYDALETVTDVKIRSNEDRIEGEEEIPDWYFEEGVVFLPEEIEAGLRIPDRDLRRVFRRVHGDLSTTAYWESVQCDLREGRVPRIRTYPESRKLRADTDPLSNE